MDRYAQQALKEYNEHSPHPGGVNGRPFWNINSSQFMYAPTFHFPNLLKSKKYRYTAKDAQGGLHCFEADTPSASLSPIWSELPEGITELKVDALDRDGNFMYAAGVRTFYKSAPFPGRSAYPPKARSYRECALEALRYVYKDRAVQHWLTHGVPEPDYPHNVYPAKTIDSILRAMAAYAKLEPENAENALKLACRAADYLISISFEEGHPLAFLPPTYSFKGLNAESVNKVAPAAWGCQGTTMMIYPVNAAQGYLALYDATGQQKYFDAALRIAEYYRANVLPCGSWYLLYDCETGKPLKNNVCASFDFVRFFRELYEKTGDECWRELETGCFRYITEVCLKTYNWEGQFEDVKVSGNYQNLTHHTADDVIGYIAQNLSDDPEMAAEAVDLMRFVEDQFVVWGAYPRWNDNPRFAQYHTPAGLEQYFCYDPINGSASAIMISFTDLYKMTGDRLYLEKAMTLGDMITQRQDAETGQIPTFFIGENCAEGRRNYWLNCQIFTAFCMMKLAELTEAEGVE